MINELKVTTVSLYLVPSLLSFYFTDEEGKCLPKVTQLVGVGP